MKPLTGIAFAVGLAMCLVSSAFSQTQVSPISRVIAPRSPAELDEMLSWIALYPDPLLAVLLPAATFPGDIVLANRYLSAGGDPESLDQQGWDPSVAAMSRYPDVLRWMDDNLSWTIALGETFLTQPQDVMDSIQRLRARAQALGNLPSSTEATVLTDNGIIEILPANPESIFIPSYDSRVIFIHSSQGQAITRKTPSRIGTWLNHDFDWPNRRIIVWSQEQSRPAGWWSYSAGNRGCLGEVHAKTWHRRGHGNPAPEKTVVNQTSHSTSATGTPGDFRSTLTVIGGKSGGASGRTGMSSGSASAGRVVQSGNSAGHASRTSATTGKSGSTATSATATRAPAPAANPYSK